VLALYRAHSAVVRARCRRLLRNDQAADDATQETFVRVLRHVAVAPADDEARAWLCRIATNICLNEIRNARTAARLSEHSSMMEAVGPSSSEERIASRDLASRVLSNLPDGVRAISVLCHVDGMHQQEVACELGMSRRTVVYRLAQFKQDAQRLLHQLDA
jgi:RNA polymerase sigma-70 factor (ECF subfamily)